MERKNTSVNETDKGGFTSYFPLKQIKMSPKATVWWAISVDDVVGPSVSSKKKMAQFYHQDETRVREVFTSCTWGSSFFDLIAKGLS